MATRSFLSRPCRAGFWRPNDPYGDDTDNFKIGGGTAIFTNNLRQALAFDDFAKLLDFVRQTHPERPVRADGESNRPLTAFTWSFAERERFYQAEDGGWYEPKPADVARVFAPIARTL